MSPLFMTQLFSYFSGLPRPCTFPVRRTCVSGVLVFFCVLICARAVRKYVMGTFLIS